VLLALPLSRRRIWLGKVLGGLALTAVGATIILGLSRLLLPQVYRILPVSPYLPDMCMALVYLFAVSAFMSSVASYTIAALVATLIFGGTLTIGLGLLWSNLGGLLLGYNPILEQALWGLVVTPAVLFASAVAISRGELLQSLRKHAFGVPALLLGLLITLALVGGIGRAATRYSRTGVQEIEAIAESPGSPLLGVIARGDPAPYQRVPPGGGWHRRGAEPIVVAHPDALWGGEPLYRSGYGVLLDLRTGREVLRVRRGFSDPRFQMAVSPDGRFAAVASGPLGLTWGVQSWKYFPEELGIFDLERKQWLFRDIPAPLIKRDNIHISDMRWSHGGDYLAFMTGYGTRLGNSTSGFYAMKPDGSEVRDLAPKPQSGEEWAWSPTENVIFATDRGRIYRVTLDGKAPEGLDLVYPTSASGSLPPHSLSPDGRWLVVTSWKSERREVRHEANGERWMNEMSVKVCVAVSAIRTDGSAVAGLWKKPLPSEPRFAWSRDGKALYVLLPESETRARLMRWRPGEGELAPVAEGLPAAVAAMEALPGSEGVLVYPTWKWGERPVQVPDAGGRSGIGYPAIVRLPATVGPAIVSNDGKVRPFPSAAESVAFASANDYITVDDAGRVITLAGPSGHQYLQATDVKSGKPVRVYP
jgi:hypothetical protein